MLTARNFVQKEQRWTNESRVFLTNDDIDGFYDFREMAVLQIKPVLIVHFHFQAICYAKDTKEGQTRCSL